MENSKFEERSEKNSKSKTQNSKEAQNSKPESSKVYDLDERTEQFAKRVREFVKTIPRTTANFEDSKQLIRASGSTAANYLEAQEAISPKDCLHRMKICRKEVREALLWLKLIDHGTNPEVIKEHKALIQEALELARIFGAIVRNMGNKSKR